MTQRSLVFLAVVAVFGFLGGCTREQDPAKTRQEAADAAAKIKEQSRQAAAELKKGAEEAGRQGKAVAEGAKEGWNSSSQVNVNQASKEELMSLPGMDDSGAQSIIAGRPYHTKAELKARGVVSPDEFDRISGRITVK